MFILSNNVLQKFDSFSNTIIKKSIPGRFLSGFKNKILNKTKEISALLPVLTLSVGIVLLSLSLPQFSEDRSGIGIIIGLCAVLFLLIIFTNNKISISFNSIDFLILIFIFLALISTMTSYFLRESIVGFVKYILFFIFYFITKITIANCSYNNFLKLLSVLVLPGFAVALIGLYQYFIGVEPLATWEDLNYENIHSRVYSTLGNPNLLAGYLLGILPLSLTIGFTLKSNRTYKFASIVISLVILSCLILTGSRGGYLGLISGVLFASFIFIASVFKKGFSFSKFLTMSFIAITLLGVIYLVLTYLFPIFLERFATIFTLREHSSNSYRLNVWASCLKMLQDNWLVGIGPGNNTFRLAYGLYMVSGFDALASYNVFLEFAVELGIFGCLTFLLILLTSFLKLHYIFWRKGNILACGIFVSLIMLMAHGLVDTVFFRPQVFIPFWFLLASIDKLESEEYA